MTTQLVTLLVMMIMVSIIAMLVRVVSGTMRSSQKPNPANSCPDCGLRIPSDESRCLRCGWGPQSEVPRAQRVIQQLQRHLELLSKRQLLSPDVTQQLRMTIQEELGRLERQRLSVTNPGGIHQPTALPVPPATIGLDAATTVLQPAPLPGSTSSTTSPSFPVPPRPTEPQKTSPVASAQPAPITARPVSLPVSTRSLNSQEAAAPIWLDKPETGPAKAIPPVPPAPKKRDWLLAFMEQRNLNWGELIGGLLIVCGSIALVISFWSQIAQSPFLKFVVFNGFTAALFAVGRYAGQRLQLPSTSRAFYAIGSLLVPLNFLAIAAFSKGASTNGLTLAGELVTTALFGWLCWRAGRVLAPSQPLAFTLGILGPSLASLVLGRLQVSGAEKVATLAWSLLPALPYVAAHILGARSHRLALVPPGPLAPADAVPSIPEPVPAASVERGWWSLATSTLAVLIPLGLLVYRSEQTPLMRHTLAPLLPLLALPGLSQGLLRSRRESSAPSSFEPLVATALSFLAMAVIGLGLVLAWPFSRQVVLTSLVGALVLAAVAVWQRRPALWLAALPGVTIAWLLLLGMFRGPLMWQSCNPAELQAALLAPYLGNALIPLVLTTLVGAASCQRRFPDDARWLLMGTGTLALLSLLSILILGFGRTGDLGGATFSLLGYGLLTLLAAVVVEQQIAPLPDESTPKTSTSPDSPLNSRPVISQDPSSGMVFGLASAGIILLTLASTQGLCFRWPGWVQYTRPAVPLLTTSLITLFLAVIGSGWTKRWTGLAFVTTSRLANWLTLGGIVLSLVAMADVALHWFRIPLGGLAWQILWSAGLWLALSWMHRGTQTVAQPIFSGFQFLLAAASLGGARQWLQSHPWSDPAPHLGRDPRTWQLLGILLSIQALGWLVLRARSTRPANQDEAVVCHSLFARPAVSGDRLLASLSLLGVLLVTGYAALPGTERELTPRNVALNLATPQIVEQARLTHEVSQQAARDRGEPASTKPFRVVPPIEAYEFSQTPHAAAAGWGTWIWLALVLALWGGWQWHWPTVRTTMGGSLALAAICPLVAFHWDSDVATASAWRWGAALWISLVASLIWISRPRQTSESSGWLAQRLADLGPDRQKLANFSQGVMLCLLAAMGLLVGALLTRQPAIWDPWRRSLGITGWLALFSALLGLLLQYSLVAMTRWSHRRDPEAKVPLLVQRFSSPVTLASWLTWILGVGPFLAVVLFLFNGALRGNPLVGPEPGTFFHQIGVAAGYAVPLIVWALVLIGHAICFAEGSYVFGAGLLLQISATSIVAYLTARAGRPLDQSLSLELILWNSLVASLAALGWQGGRRRLGFATSIIPGEADSSRIWNRQQFPPLLVTQCVLGMSLWVISQILVVSSMTALRSGIAAQGVFASVPGIVSGALALLALAAPLEWRGLRTGHIWRTLACGTAALLLAHTLAQRDLSGGLSAWPVLRLCLVGAAFGLWLLEVGLRQRAADQTGEIPQTRLPGVAILGCLALGLTLSEIGRGGANGWTAWELRGLGAVGLLHVLWSRDRRWLWSSALLLPLAEISRWLSGATVGISEFQRIVERGDSIWQSLLPTALVALWLDHVATASSPPDHEPLAGWLPRPGFQRGVGWLGVAWFSFTVVLAAFAGGLSAVVPASHLWSLIGLIVIWTLCLRDGQREVTLLPLYLSGLLLFASIPLVLAPELRWRLTFQGQLLAGYTALSYLLWWRRHDCDRVAEWLGIIPFHREAGTNRRWLARATQFVSTLVLVITFITVWTEVSGAIEPLRRVQMASGAWAPILVLGLLCRSSDDGRLHGRALRRAAFASIFWAWAWFPVNWLLVRFSIQAAALLLLALNLSLLVSHWSRLSATWSSAIQRILPWLMGTGLATVLLIVGLEATVLSPARTREEYIAVAIVAGALVLFAGLCLAATLLPGRDPLRLAESRKTLWVYASEGLLTLLFLHLRLSLPWLFSGLFQAYWPFFLLFLAFVGLGLSEVFRRRNLPVLAEPLENTGMWLPLLPLLVFWLNASAGQSSLSMLLGGLFYGVLSVRRKSVALGLLAVVAVNASLWLQLQHLEGFRLLQHPQLWFIPFALCLLAASWIHRDRLTPTQRSTLRYLSSTLIYTSSTIEIFLNGLAKAPWLAVVLAGLSVLGVLAGMVLRVRSFLFQGTAFLGVALLTLLWHAAFHLHQTWLIWLTVIFAGVAILTLFALFERKRQQMIELVGQLREWSN
jgi:hypothetical protein